MNAELHIPVRPEGASRISESFSAVGAKLGQRMKELRALQAKYDTMLYLLEFMVSFQPINTRDPEQARKVADLKSLVIQERDRLGLRESGSR